MEKAILYSLPAILLSETAIADTGDYYPMMGYGMIGGYGYGTMLLWWITYVLFIALILAAIYWLIKSANRKK